MQAVASQDTLLPRPPGGNGIGAVLALVVHAGLVAALAWSVSWRQQPQEIIAAELWAAVPQEAAPRPVETPVPEPTPAAPPAPPPPPPAPALREADIALERARNAQVERERREAEARQREKEERERERREQLERERQERQERERQQRQRAEEQARAKAEEERLARLREEQLRRMMGEAAGTGAATSRGSAAADAAPSADYAGRLVALIRRNIVFTGSVNALAAPEVEVRLAPGGTVISRRLLKSSGNPEWDEAVLRAIDRTGSLPPDANGRVPAQIVITFRPRE